MRTGTRSRAKHKSHRPDRALHLVFLEHVLDEHPIESSFTWSVHVVVGGFIVIGLCTGAYAGF